MSINRRDIIQILRDENKLLKERNKQVGNKLARLQQAFRVLTDLDGKTRKITKVDDFGDLFYQLLELVMHACNTEHGSLILIDEESQELEFVEVIGDTREELKNYRIGINTGVVGHTISTNKPVLIDNVHSSKDWSSTIDDFLGFQTMALMCAPLEVDGRVIGAIEVVNKSTESSFDENDLNVLQVAARFISMAVESAEKAI